MDDKRSASRQYPGVMVSSTFADLKQHRAALMQAIEAQGLHALAMEQDSARPTGTVIDSSVQKVHEAAAYIGVISHKYGQVPDSTESNPSRFSLTELEFLEARRLGRPILIFIMGEDHDVKPADVERNLEKAAKLEAFREEVKRAGRNSHVYRVYKEFNSLHEFKLAASYSVAELRRLLDQQSGIVSANQPNDGIPRPPAIYAEPHYIGSHSFVGRAAELKTLLDWAMAADPHPMLLFGAIGGAGKSMLTWEWAVNHSSGARTDWAGTFWYSFYEKGAVMADFCRRALAYMTGQSLKTLRKKRWPELTELLLRQLQASPWLLVLDGLERVLVAYHRYDAPQLADEEAGRTDEIGRRDPAAAIRPRDDELLRGLVGAAPSKILITSRLLPRVLLNQAGQPIPGVRHEHLSGLRPADAEALLRSCDVWGDSQVIQDYLRRNFDCHPLVTGVVAGLVHDYLADRSHFDAWAADPGHGGRLNLAELDLVQKRNHILQAAVAALPDKSRQLLSTLALLSESVDYGILVALNPYMPDQQLSGRDPRFNLKSREDQSAIHELARTVRDLERRGLLLYNRQAERYDLHPVVRGYVSGRLRAADRNRLGQRVVDYFSQQAKDPYEQAETLDDVRNGLQLVRTLLQMGRAQAAADAFSGELTRALFFNLEAYAEILSLLRPFFTPDWTSPSVYIRESMFAHLANEAAIAFHEIGYTEQALAVRETVLQADLNNKEWRSLRITLSHMAQLFAEQNRLAKDDQFVLFALDVAERLDSGQTFRAWLDRFWQLTETGRWAEAKTYGRRSSRYHETGRVPSTCPARPRKPMPITSSSKDA